MKTNEKFNFKSLKEVWEWKDAVYKDIKNMNIHEKKEYYREGLELAAKNLGAHLVQNSDGSYLIR